MIAIEGLGFRYPTAERDALHDFSLTVPDGCLFGLLGPNGSGKTTLMSLLTGLLRPTSGHIRLGRAEHAGPRVALVPQEYAFYPQLTVMENLRFFAGVCGVEPGEHDARLGWAIEAAGLGDFRRMRAQRLSGGLKRRLNLAIGLLNKPELLLLDEPTVGIDPQSRSFILETVREIHRAGTTIVYTSHYMEEVEALCSDIGVLDQGELIARGSLDDLLRGNRDAGLMLDLLQPPDEGLRRALARFAQLRIDNAVIRADSIRAEDMRAVLQLLLQQGAGIARMRYGQGNLEALFLHLTGRGLRD